MKYMVEEPLEYYKKIFSMLVAENRIKDSDYTPLAEELHYGFLGLFNDGICPYENRRTIWQKDAAENGQACRLCI